MTPPQVPERFRILEELAARESEVLYRAHDLVLERDVVLKRPGPAARAALRGRAEWARALREARALARVRHPGVVRLLDMVETEEGPLLVMEPLVGEPLAERLAREGGLDPEEVRALGIRLADALHAVHAAGHVHRGLSVDSVLIRPDGEVTLTGFVFAKLGSAGFGLSSIDYRREHAPRPKDLPRHPAPEQVAGQAADARSDVFGLGCVLYTCLTGEEPFGAASWSPPRDPRERAPRAPADLCRTIRRCLAHSPLARFQTAAALAEALARRAGAVPPRAAGRKLRRPAAVAAVMVAAGLAVTLVVGGGEGPPQDAERGRRPVPVGPERGTYSARYAASRALVIGIDDYGEGFRPLRNARRDAEAIADRLRAMSWEGWRVRRLLGPQATRTAILEALADLKHEAGRDDRLLVYYAGHGVTDPGDRRSGWIVPSDGRPLERDRGHVTHIGFGEVLGVFGCEAKHVLIAMDCCFGGRSVGSLRGAERSRVRETLLRHRARVVLSSGLGDQQVWDSVRAGGHSPFARAFLDALQSREGDLLTSTGLFERMRRSFDRWKVPHSPRHGYDLPSYQPGGDFVFFLKPR